MSGQTPVLIAFDPSIVSSGWAFGHERGTILSSGTVTVKPAGLSDAERVSRMVWDLVDAVDAARGAPEVTILIEVAKGFSYARSSRGGKSLNQKDLHKQQWVVGGLLAVCAGWGRVIVVDANTWKGNRPKWMDRAMAPGASSTDEADARGLLEWYQRIGHKLMESSS